jgi:hypothetical protein
MPTPRKVAAGVPTSQQSDRAPKHQWPRYLVSAPHAVSCEWSSAHARRPYGTWHARSVGDLQTVCGISAVDWQIFWTLRFEPSRTEACLDCVATLRAQATAR